MSLNVWSSTIFHKYKNAFGMNFLGPKLLFSLWLEVGNKESPLPGLWQGLGDLGGAGQTRRQELSLRPPEGPGGDPSIAGCSFILSAHFQRAPPEMSPAHWDTYVNRWDPVPALRGPQAWVWDRQTPQQTVVLGSHRCRNKVMHKTPSCWEEGRLGRLHRRRPYL